MHIQGAVRHWEKGTRWGDSSEVGSKEVMENRPQGNAEVTEGLENMALVESWGGRQRALGRTKISWPSGAGTPLSHHQERGKMADSWRGVGSREGACISISFFTTF